MGGGGGVRGEGGSEVGEIFVDYGRREGSIDVVG